MDVSDKDYRVLELLASDGSVTQRSLARLSGVSHGLANIIVRRLIRIGWVKARSVDGRRLRYFLTPEGLRHVTRRSMSYVEKTLRAYRDLRRGVERLIDTLVREGKSHFLVVGEGDIPHIVEDVLRSKAGINWESVAGTNGRPLRAPSDRVAILDCRWKGREIGVSVLHEILRHPPR